MKGLIGDREHHGVSIASRFPFTEVQEVDLHLTRRTSSYPCGALVTTIAGPVGDVVVVNHGPAWEWWAEAERELQAVAVARAVEEQAPDDMAPVILGGDLNAQLTAGSLRFFTGLQTLDALSVSYQDCWSTVHPGELGWTLDPRNPYRAEEEPQVCLGRTSDYLMLRCGVHGPPWRIADCRLAFDSPSGGVWASDHFGLIADFDVEPFADRLH